MKTTVNQRAFTGKITEEKELSIRAMDVNHSYSMLQFNTQWEKLAETDSVICNITVRAKQEPMNSSVGLIESWGLVSCKERKMAAKDYLTLIEKFNTLGVGYYKILALTF